MKCKILHESPGRMRIRTLCGAMSLRQADILEAYLKKWTVPSPLRSMTAPATL